MYFGSDGIRSSIRNQIFPNTELASVGEEEIVGIVHLPELKNNKDLFLKGESPFLMKSKRNETESFLIFLKRPMWVNDISILTIGTNYEISVWVGNENEKEEVLKKQEVKRGMYCSFKKKKASEIEIRFEAKEDANDFIYGMHELQIMYKEYEMKNHIYSKPIFLEERINKVKIKSTYEKGEKSNVSFYVGELKSKEEKMPKGWKKIKENEEYRLAKQVKQHVNLMGNLMKKQKNGQSYYTLHSINGKKIKTKKGKLFKGIGQFKKKGMLWNYEDRLPNKKDWNENKLRVEENYQLIKKDLNLAMRSGERYNAYQFSLYFYEKKERVIELNNPEKKATMMVQLNEKDFLITNEHKKLRTKKGWNELFIYFYFTNIGVLSTSGHRLKEIPAQIELKAFGSSLFLQARGERNSIKIVDEKTFLIQKDDSEVAGFVEDQICLKHQPSNEVYQYIENDKDDGIFGMVLKVELSKHQDDSQNPVIYDYTLYSG